MMLKVFAALFLLLWVSDLAHAEFDSGNSVYADCKNPLEAAQASCLMEAGAFLDMMMALGYSCDLDGVTRGQVKDVLVKSLADHPASRNKSAALLAIFTYVKAFNCRMPSQK